MGASAAILRREAEALDLRAAGRRYDQIAEALGMTERAARIAVRRCLERVAEEADERARALRDVEDARLDAITAALWENRGDPKAAAVLVRIAERRAKLWGLDVDRGAGVTVNVGDSDERVVVVVPDNGRGPTEERRSLPAGVKAADVVVDVGG